MTYCLGWKTEKSVFITADTAVTYKDAREKKYLKSSFGEVHENQDDCYVEEGILKIRSFYGVIAGYAGNIHLANDMITKIEIQNQALSIRKSILTVIDHFNYPDEVQIIIGFIDQGQPVLLSYNANSDRQIIEHDDIVQIGNIGLNPYVELSRKTINLFVNVLKIEDKNLLVCVNAVLQNYGIFDDMMKFYIGGAFCGASINKEGITWQDDTAYMIINQKTELHGYITVLVREEGMVTASTFNDNVVKIFFSSVTEADIQKWQEKWMKKVFRDIWNGDSNYYVFYSDQFRNIIVVTPEGLIKNNYIKKTADGSGNFQLNINGAIIDEITRMPAQNNEFPYNLIIVDEQILKFPV